MKNLLFFLISLICFSTAKAQDASPPYPGMNLGEYIKQHLRLPDAYAYADAPKIGFTVTASGTIEGVHILQSGHPGYDTLALATVKGMPKWRPGHINHMLVPMYCMIDFAKPSDYEPLYRKNPHWEGESEPFPTMK